MNVNPDTKAGNPPRLVVRAILLVAVVVAALAIVFAFTVTRPPVFPSLPNPNGYDDFVRAGKAAVGDASSYSGLDLQSLRALVVTNAEALRLARVGLSRQCSFPTEAGITNFAATMLDVATLRTVALLFRAEGRLAELEGRPADAARDYLEGLRLGNEISRGGFLVQRMVGLACEAINAIPLAKLVHALTCEQVRPLTVEIDKFDQARVTYDEVRRLERRLGAHELLKEANPVNWVTGWLQTRALLSSYETRHNAAVAHERLVLVEMALLCYTSDHGTAPARLEQLVPQYLSRIPQDPFTGRPMIYKPQSTSWVVYSVGPDRVDDGGRPSSGRLGSGDLLFDSPW